MDKKPSKSSFVDEGNNISLHWTYRLDGTLRTAAFRLPPSITIAVKHTSGLTVGPAYINRTLVDISDNETTITILAVDRLDSGRYEYQITNSKFASATSDVMIAVRCK